MVCSFVPRLYDYHPDAIPAPYHHSNIDSDELLYYVAGEFMSRKHVTQGMITLHPAGIPHGPHPGDTITPPALTSVLIMPNLIACKNISRELGAIINFTPDDIFLDFNMEAATFRSESLPFVQVPR